MMLTPARAARYQITGGIYRVSVWDVEPLETLVARPMETFPTMDALETFMETNYPGCYRGRVVLV